MAENLWKSLGTIGIAPKGTYNPDTTYYRGHLVSYEGSSYVALKNELTNVTPTDDDINWSLVMKGYNEKIIQATIPSNGWVGDTAPYTQTITVEGISEDDNPVVDIILSDDIETMQAQLEDYGKILKITTGDGNITVYSSDLTTTDLTILMKGVNFATEITEIDADKVGIVDTNNIVGNGAGNREILQTFLDNVGNDIKNLKNNNRCGYGVCTTAETTSIKSVTINNFEIKKGSIVSIRFLYNVKSDSSLKINNIRYSIIRSTNISDNIIDAGALVTFVFDGDYLRILNIENPFITDMEIKNNETKYIICNNQTNNIEQFFNPIDESNRYSWNNKLTVDEDGWISGTVFGTSSDSDTPSCYNFDLVPNFNLKPNTDYLCIVEVAKNTGLATIYIHYFSPGQRTTQFSTKYSVTVGRKSESMILTTKNDFSSARTMLDSFVEVPYGHCSDIKFRVSLIEDTSISLDDYVYPTQHPQYPYDESTLIPTNVGKEGIVYLVPKSNGVAGNKYDKYIWVNNEYEKI